MHTKITSDGGLSERYLQDTLPAFMGAVSAGAERLELDVQRSSDGELLVHHLYVLGTTNDGEGIVFERDAAYIRSLDAGGWFSPAFAGERIPFLAEVLEAIGSCAEYELDLKLCEPTFLEAVLELVERLGLIRVVEFTSAHHFLLAQLKQRCPHARIGVFEHDYPGWMSLELGHILTLQRLDMGAVDVAHCPVSILTEDFVADLHGRDAAVHASLCDTEALMQALSLGVDQLSTTHLELALSVRAEARR